MTGEEIKELQELRERVGFGLDVQVFMASNPIGRYLELRAIQAVEAAQALFVDADPFDHKAILALQLRIRSAENWLGWLSEAVADGEQAEAVMRGETSMPDEDPHG